MSRKVNIVHLNLHGSSVRRKGTSKLNRTCFITLTTFLCLLLPLLINSAYGSIKTPSKIRSYDSSKPGWSDSFVVSKGVPTYDAIRDSLCPLGHTAKFNSYASKKSRLEKAHINEFDLVLVFFSFLSRLNYFCEALGQRFCHSE